MLFTSVGNGKLFRAECTCFAEFLVFSKGMFCYHLMCLLAYCSILMSHDYYVWLAILLLGGIR